MSSDDVRERVARWLYDYWEEVTGHPPLTVCNPQSRWFDDADELLSLIDRTQAEEIERLAEIINSTHADLFPNHGTALLENRLSEITMGFRKARAELEQLRSQEPVAWMVESQFNGSHGARVTFYDEGEAARYVMELQSINGWTATIHPLGYIAAPPDGERSQEPVGYVEEDSLPLSGRTTLHSEPNASRVAVYASPSQSQEPVADLLVYRHGEHVDDRTLEIRVREEHRVRLLQRIGRFPLYAATPDGKEDPNG